MALNLCLLTPAVFDMLASAKAVKSITLFVLVIAVFVPDPNRNE